MGVLQCVRSRDSSLRAADALLSWPPPRRINGTVDFMREPTHRSPCTSIYSGRKIYRKRIQTKYIFHSNKLCKRVMQTGPGYTNRLCKWVPAHFTLACRRRHAAHAAFLHAQKSHGHPFPAGHARGEAHDAPGAPMHLVATPHARLPFPAALSTLCTVRDQIV